MKRGQGREQRGRELIKGVCMDLNDEEKKKISIKCYCPPCLEFAVATAAMVMVLLVGPTPPLCLWLLQLLV